MMRAARGAVNRAPAPVTRITCARWPGRLRKRSMSRVTRAGMLAATASAVGALAVAVLAIHPGCTSDCHEICPPVIVQVRTAANVDIGIQYLDWRGPACPSVPPECRGDSRTTVCTHTEIAGAAAGGCDLLIGFSDRPPEIVHAEFGEAKACCPGHPVLGDYEFIIPVSADAGIYGADGGDTDAVTIVYDAGAGDAVD